MKNTGLLLLGAAMMVAACSSGETDHSEHDATKHAAAGDAEDHSGHQMGPLSEKAIKDKKEAAELLVKRFGVEACAKADLLGSTRRTSPDDGETIMRAYQVPIDCAREATKIVSGNGYTQDAPNTYAGTSPDGTAETVRIQLDPAEESSAVIEWEATQK